MDVSYQWYNNSGHLSAYYPSPTPSSDPSPTPRPHQPLHDQYLPHAFDQIQSNVGPERPLRGPRKSRPLSEHAADRFSDPVFLQQVTPPYRPGSPSSMASPYSPYDYSQRPRSRSISTPDIVDPLRIPSPAPSIGSAGTSLSAAGSTSHHRADPPPLPIQKPKQTKNRLRDVDRKDICIFHLTHKNARQEDIGLHFGVERSTISKVLKEKEKWLRVMPEAESNKTVKHRPSKFPEIEEILLESLQHWSDRKISITDQLIRSKGLEIARGYNITTDRFKGSSGWVENFKHRHDIKRGEWLHARKLHQRPTQELQPRIIPEGFVPLPPYERPQYERPEPESPSEKPFELPDGCPPLETPGLITTIIRRQGSVPPTWAMVPRELWHRNLQGDRQAQAQVLAIQDRAREQAREQHQQEKQEKQQQQQQQQSALVLDPALQDVRAVTSPLDTTHAQHSPHHNGAYENGMGMMYASGAGSGANNNNNTDSPSTPSNPASSSSTPNPTYQDAEHALKVVISFLESDGRDIVKDSDRETLAQIRAAMSQWSNRVYGTIA